MDTAPMPDDDFTFDDAMRLQGLDPDVVRRRPEDTGPSPSNYMVRIVSRDGDVVEEMGPMTQRKADQVSRGISINLNHAEYVVNIVEADA